MKHIYILSFTLILLFTTLHAQVSTVNVCQGELVCLTSGTYTGTLQWQSSSDMTTWTDIPSATTDTFCFTASINNYYRAEITNGSCDPVYSDTTFLNIQVVGTNIDTFFYTGASQTFTVPLCIDSITITCYGASGGLVTTSSVTTPGLGAMMSGKFAVSNGQVLTIIVGARGNDETYTSGGGGGSGVTIDTTLLIIAGGGAGKDFQDMSYSGANGTTSPNGNVGNGGGGAGGTAGSDGGDNIYSGDNISRGGRGWNSGIAGSTGQNGSSSNTVTTLGTFGLGGGGGSVGSGWCNCGAGGGGYSGGGAGQINTSGGGGGSYNIGVNQNNVGGVHSGDGMVIISY